MTLLRTGITTGTCAAAAAKAAAMVLCGQPAPESVELVLPGGQPIEVPILYAKRASGRAVAAVRKDAGDDPDVTNGLEVVVTIWPAPGDENVFLAGEGVGTVTKPGLQVPPGQPAINPVPRRMIATAIAEVMDAVPSRRPIHEKRLREGIPASSPPEGPFTNSAFGRVFRHLPLPKAHSRIAPSGGYSEDPAAYPPEGVKPSGGKPSGGKAFCVEVAIPGGRQVAERTFNPRLGIIGGLSVLGTTGIVRPYCRKALRDSLKCSLDVAAACGVRDPVLVPGNIGAKAARSHFALAEEQVIEVGNEWGYVLDLLVRYPFAGLLVAGHPGKLAKLGAGEWDTHSARSASPVGLVGELCREVLGQPAPESPTVEGLFAALDPTERKRLADSLAGRVRAAVSQKISGVFPVAVLLVNMAGHELGSDGDFTPWRQARSQS